MLWDCSTTPMTRPSLRPVRKEIVITPAAEELRRYIEASKLAPDAPLPPETHLSRMLGISRNSVREALRILDGLGFIQKAPGKRVVVRSLSTVRQHEPAAAVDEAQLASALGVAHQVRFLVEEKCAEIAATRRSEAAIAQIEGHLGSFAEALKRSDYSAASHAHEDFHRSIVLAADNAFLTALFDQARRVESSVLRAGHGTLKDRRQLPMHGAVLKAIRAGDPAAAVDSLCKHFHTVAPVVEFLFTKTPKGRAPRPAGGGGGR